jgi:serine/threonine protein kinase
VWAIGVIFYEMLTGSTPWRAKTEADLKRQIKAVPIKSILPVGVSKLGAAFLTRALQLNPASRMGPD